MVSSCYILNNGKNMYCSKCPYIWSIHIAMYLFFWKKKGKRFASYILVTAELKQRKKHYKGPIKARTCKRKVLWSIHCRSAWLLAPAVRQVLTASLIFASKVIGEGEGQGGGGLEVSEDSCITLAPDLPGD